MKNPLRLIALLLLCGASATLAGTPGDDLLAAARRSDLAAVKAALEAGADVNAKTAYGGTALMLAAERGSLEIVGLLVERGADVNLKDSFYGGDALMSAAQGEHAEIVKRLIEAGATGGDELLTMSAAGGSLPMVQ